MEGAAHADIARDLGLSEGATRQLVLRARTTLRSAASAVMPLPVLQWFVSTGGAGAEFAKAGAVALVAGTAVAAPVVVVDRAVEPKTARAERRRQQRRRRNRGSGSSASGSSGSSDNSGPGSSGSGSSGSSGSGDTSGSGGSGGSDDIIEGTTESSSGSGGSGSG